MRRPRRSVLLFVTAVALAASTVAAGPAPSAARAGGGDALDGADGGDAIDPRDAVDTTDGLDAGQGARPDPAADRLGWEAGRWHDDPLDVTVADGLTGTELDAVVARSMARVEAVRRLEFRETPPVSVLDRETYRERVANRSPPSAAARLHQNVKLEALFFVGEDTDAVATLRADAATTTLGYYDPATERIVVVTDGGNAPVLSERTLAQELFHALQDQVFGAFDRPWYPGNTTEAHLAADGVIEGDGNFVEYLYGERCGSDWNCLGVAGGGDSAPPPHYGWSVLQYAPYSDGAAFVAARHDAGGWPAVNALYDAPTASTEQYIHPEAYPDDAPERVAVPEHATRGWHVLDVPGPTDYATLGEAGVFAMLWYPSHVSTVAGDGAVVVPYDIFGEAPPDAIDYRHPASTGWDGDRLVPYVNASPGSTNETAYVWRLAWDTPADAREFADAYRQVLAFNGAEPVPVAGQAAGETTYRLDDSRGFADAVHVAVDGDRVTVTNAPTLAALSAVRPGVDVRPVATTSAGGGPVGGPAGLAAAVGFLVAVALLAAAGRTGGDRR
ncbi:MAG: Hvo_1808 family surface protein [Halobacteriaceae archaeon]